MKRFYTGVFVIFIVFLAIALWLNCIFSVPKAQLPETQGTVQDSFELQPITDFSKVAFIGDSRTQGLMLYSGITEATYYTETGLTVNDVVEKPIVDETKTIIECLKDNNFERVYIMLGTNELGWAYIESFESAYNRMLDEIMAACPETELVLQNIIPVNRELMKNPKDYINNQRIAEFNAVIEKISNERQIKRIDAHSIMCDENGDLYKEASTDGIHLNYEFCQRWAKFIKGEKPDEI